jgi:hypothetical protein
VVNFGFCRHGRANTNQMRRALAPLCLAVCASTVPVHARAFPSAPSWDTLPLFFHSSNESGLWNAAAVARIATFPLVTLEKSQGWNNASDTRPEEARARDAAAQIKAANASVTVLYYLNSLINWPFPALASWLEAHPQFELRNASGQPAVMTLGGQATALHLFDQGAAEMRAQWSGDVLAQVDSGDFDGCFADRSHNLTNWGPEARLSPAQATAWQAGHHALLDNVTVALAARNATLLQNNRLAAGVQAAMIEDFGASEACITALQAADALGILVEAHAGDLPGGTDAHCAGGVTNSLAAFLIGAGRRAYYGCSPSWTTDPRWPAVPDAWLDPRPEYSRPLGLPTGPGVRSGSGVWARNFSAGVTVTFDVAHGTGRIVWSDGTVQQGGGPPDPPKPGACAWQTE